MTERVIVPPMITFSHGGAGELPSYPPVRGDAVSEGLPIEVWRAMGGGFNWPSMVALATGTLSVGFQGNIGPMLADGTLDPDMWFTFQSYNMNAGEAQTIACPTAFGWVRTKITSRSTGELFSGVGPICIAPGKIIKAQYPSLKAGGTG